MSNEHWSSYKLTQATLFTHPRVLVQNYRPWGWGVAANQAKTRKHFYRFTAVDCLHHRSQPSSFRIESRHDPSVALSAAVWQDWDGLVVAACARRSAPAVWVGWTSSDGEGGMGWNHHVLQTVEERVVVQVVHFLAVCVLQQRIRCLHKENFVINIKTTFSQRWCHRAMKTYYLMSLETLGAFLLYSKIV